MTYGGLRVRVIGQLLAAAAVAGASLAALLDRLDRR